MMAAEAQEAYLIAADVDGTLWAGDWASRRDQAESRRSLGSLRGKIVACRNNNPDTPLLFGTVTGRTLESLHELEADSEFRRSVAEMDVLIGSVGAEIVLREKKGFMPVRTWPGGLSGWDREKAQQVLLESRSVGQLKLQEAMAQSALKLSFTAEGIRGSEATYAEEVRRLLGRSGVQATVTFSGGMFLDILPRTADGGPVDKGTAIHSARTLLAERRSLLHVPRVAFTGDSRNDTAGFAYAIESGGVGVIPGNADSGFKREMRKQYKKRLYIAEQPFAAGVQEGLEHFGVLV
jgi:sucrose-6-phosphatase